MTTQMELTEWAKFNGMRVTLDNTADEWKAEFVRTADYLLETWGSVTSEMIVDKIGYPPNHSSAIGAMTHAWAKKRSLVCTYEKSTRVSSHAAIIGRWSKPQ